MSAIREVKYLRELRHQNVIEVSFLSECEWSAHAYNSRSHRLSAAARRLFFENKS
jgi:hypothetical protein